MPPYGREKYFFEYKKYFIASKPPFHGHFQCHMQKNTAKKRACIDALSTMCLPFPQAKTARAARQMAPNSDYQSATRIDKNRRRTKDITNRGSAMALVCIMKKIYLLKKHNNWPPAFRVMSATIITCPNKLQTNHSGHLEILMCRTWREGRQKSSAWEGLESASGTAAAPESSAKRFCQSSIFFK